MSWSGNSGLIPFFPLVAGRHPVAIEAAQSETLRDVDHRRDGVVLYFALRAFFATLGGGEHTEVQRAIWNFTWFKFGNTSLDLGLILDPLTAGMAAMVSFVGFWIFVNATGLHG